MLKIECHDAGRETSGSHDHRIRTAVILAAGMGVRLQDRGERTPKGCLRLGDKTIVEESVLQLLAVGIQRIVIVTGHLAEQFQPLQARYQAVQLVHNPHFADSGTMYSLYCARDYVDESFLLLEADLVYERRALTTCLRNPSENVILLASVSNTGDECYVETHDGHLVAISKNRESLGSEVPGEMVGISKVSRSLFSLMIGAVEQRFRTTRHLDYETDGLVLTARAADIPVSCPLVEDLIWCEIDDEIHLAHARRTIYPFVDRPVARAEVDDTQRLLSDLSKFKKTGFFDERELIIRHLHDFFETVNRRQIRACIMFGTLLGKLRHDDFIPWDDDVDIVVFDFDAFQEQCEPELERQGYTVEPQIRDGQRMGSRIFREDSAKVPGRPSLRFPWIGIWEHEVLSDGMVRLVPEINEYRLDDFLPIRRAEFLGVSIGMPHHPTALLNTYFGSDDWMEYCQLPCQDHRNGIARTEFPDDKFKLTTVLDYLASEHSRETDEVDVIDAE
jgi:2-aminoethylphosphonate-pyruvate transaminase